MIDIKRSPLDPNDGKAVSFMTDKAKNRRKRALRRIITTIIVLALLAGAGWFAYNSLKAEYTVTYDTYTATTGSISNALSFSGNVSLIDSASYAASVSGTVRTIYAQAGNEVQEGDKLLRMNSGETVTADFAGRVNKLSVAEGDEVTQGAELVQIADFRHLLVSFRVDEYDIGDIAVGLPCTVTITALEKAFESTVESIDFISSSTGNVAYYTATALLEVDDPAVLPGMQATVSITREETQDAVILKVDAISFDQKNQAYVWMKNDAGELEQRAITTGVSNGNYIEVTEGLNDGDEVYAEAKETETASTGLFGALFGAQQFNQPQGGPGGGFGGPNGERGNWNRDGGQSQRSGTGGGSNSRPGGGN